jgi:hypothetical protein
MKKILGQVTKIELEQVESSATLVLYLSDGSVYNFGSHGTGTGILQIKEPSRVSKRPNKIDSKVLEYISDVKNWKIPSHRDIAENVGCHYSYIQKAFSNLQRDGLIDLNFKPVPHSVEGKE